MEDEPIASVVQDMRKGSEMAVRISGKLPSLRWTGDVTTDGEVSETAPCEPAHLKNTTKHALLFIILGGGCFTEGGWGEGEKGNGKPRESGGVEEEKGGRRRLWCGATCLLVLRGG